MKTLTTLSIALVMAFAISGPVSFTSTPAHAEARPIHEMLPCWLGFCNDGNDFGADAPVGPITGGRVQ
ncbi:MAG: hypothetical protein V6Z81_07520 [Parvularculales bacterium]